MCIIHNEQIVYKSGTITVVEKYVSFLYAPIANVIDVHF